MCSTVKFRIAALVMGMQAVLVCSHGWAQGQAAAAQGSAAAQDSAVTTLRTQSNLVLVPTLVKTKAGALVYTLKASDFTITDNGVEQRVSLDEDTGSQPLALVVAVETGGAGGRQLEKYRDLGTMIEAIVGNVRHEVAVVGFDSKQTVAQGFTPDMDMVAKALGDLAPGNKGAAILDALAFSVEMLGQQPPEYRRAILLLSETVDQGSGVKLADALRDIGDTNTAIYSLAFSSPKSAAKHEGGKMFSDQPGPAGGCMSKEAAVELDETRMQQAWNCLATLAPPLRLGKMAALLAMSGMRRNAPETVAHLTGGEYYKFKDERGLQKGLQTISNNVPNRYVLSFHPQSPQPGPHALEVKLKDYSNLVVTARSSYWANGADAAGR